MNRTGKLLILVLMVGLVAWAVSDAFAQRGRIGRVGGTGAYQYVVKFVCGVVVNAADQELAPGYYYTDINIHNPNDETVKFRKKVALDGFEPQQHGLKTSPVEVILGADEALEINCTDIVRLLVGSGINVGGFLINDPYLTGIVLEGFVVLYSRVELDVAGIYTVCGIGCDPEISGTAADFISSIQVDQPISRTPVAAPQVYIDGLSVSASGVELRVKPFSRFAYEGARLQVFDINGNLLHDSGFTTGTRLTWRPLAANGQPLANGVYLYAVTVQDTLGRYSTKIGKFALVR